MRSKIFEFDGFVRYWRCMLDGLMGGVVEGALVFLVLFDLDEEAITKR